MVDGLADLDPIGPMPLNPAAPRPEHPSFGSIVPLKQIEYGVYADLIIIYPKPYSIYLEVTVGFVVYTALHQAWGIQGIYGGFPN